MLLHKRKVTQNQLVPENFKNRDCWVCLQTSSQNEWIWTISKFYSAANLNYVMLCLKKWNFGGFLFQVDYMDENEEYFQRQASHRQSRRRFRKINQKGERQTIIDTVDPYPVGKPPLPRGYHTVSYKRIFLYIFSFLLGVLWKDLNFLYLMNNSFLWYTYPKCRFNGNTKYG